MRRVFYVGYYDTETNWVEQRYYVPSATTKMDYVVSALIRAGCAVEIVSVSATRGAEEWPGRSIKLANGSTLRLLRTIPWGSLPRRVLSRLHMRAQLLLWMVRNTRRGDCVIVYHSLGYVWTLTVARLVRRFALVLEVEEIYADVSGSKSERQKEDMIFSRADAFIVSTELLRTRVSPGARPLVVAHGSYACRTRLAEPIGDGRVHVVYAGTFDERKGGAQASVMCSRLLDDGYHLHVIGFGTDSDTRALRAMIAESEVTGGCVVSLEGMLHGDAYDEFLQRCHIGLSAQKGDTTFSETSFPSKVLSYMANGLKVVSTRLRVLEESDIDDLIVYAEDNSPESLAAAIRAAAGASARDPRERLRALDAAFVLEIWALLAKCGCAQIEQ